MPGMIGFLAEGGTATVSGALTTGLSTVASDALSAVTAIVPVALPIVGAGVVIAVGIKMFKKVTGR